MDSNAHMRRTIASSSRSAAPGESPEEGGSNRKEDIGRFAHLMDLRNTARQEQMLEREEHANETSRRYETNQAELPMISELVLNQDVSQQYEHGQGDISTRLDSDSPAKEDDVLNELARSVTFVEEFGHIAIDPQPRLHHVVNTEVFPYYPAQNTVLGREFWLAAAIIDCADYNTTAAMLECGAIQFALSAYRAEPTHEVRILLVTLLRLAASCYTHAHLLLSVQTDIFSLLFDCLKVNRAKPALFDSIVQWNQISDSRAYNSFLGIAFGAHTRPIGVQYDSMLPEQKWLYEKHVQIVCTAYGSLFQNPRDYFKLLPQCLASYHQSFYLSDVAAEIFVDLAPHGFFNAFTATVVEVKWDRCFNLYLENAQFNTTTMKLYRLLHQAPRTVAAHLASPFSIYTDCLVYLCWGLQTILENEYYRNTTSSVSHTRTPVPIDFCTSCAETLRAFLDFPTIGPFPALREARAVLRQHDVIYEFLRFVLAMPNVVDAKKDPNLDMLYASVWSLIHATSYTFPFMFGTLVDFACDGTVPDCLGFQAASYVAAAVSFARVQLKRSEVLGVYRRLVRQLQLSLSEPSLVRRRRQELVFRMAVILCPRHFGIYQEELGNGDARAIPNYVEETVDPNVDQSGVISMAQIFVPYDFTPEADENRRENLPSLVS